MIFIQTFTVFMIFVYLILMIFQLFAFSNGYPFKSLKPHFLNLCLIEITEIQAILQLFAFFHTFRDFPHFRFISILVWVNFWTHSIVRIEYCEFFVMLISKNIFVCGVIISIGSRIVTLQGFLMAFLGQLFRVSNSNSFGLLVNLYRDDAMNLLTGALLLNPEDRLSDRAKVDAISRLASILLEDFAIGSILDPLSNLILNEDRVDVQYR